ncbi:NAD(P)-dependent oxidoreductase [Amycolatopsis tolypomycina]|uniref:Putative NADH-flavin reductase n=1 Tax=Amycolatopsis tolypomycina TaxID=208445 RepID=A0A1H5APE3_9PSEU|nr:SDR family oxidoreductase [Amycolatopsis tolypomycina]SED44259.1 Putative NADH-flavin reductase [Amycolatopsis tolypomycina]
MSKLVVFGANGATGHAIVEQALRDGHHVRAAVRDPATFRPVRAELPPELEVVRGNVLDHEEVRAALSGQDAVISAIGPSGSRSGGLYSGSARHFVTAMTEEGADRIVVLSSSGVRHDDPHHPRWYRAVARTLMRELYGDMRAMEHVLESSLLNWTAVRPSRIVDAPATGNYRVGDAENPEGGTAITRDDLARFVVRAATEDRWSRRRPTLAR